jgi:hypothetical protein
MIRVAFFIPWLMVFLALGLGTIGRSEGAEIFRGVSRAGEPGVVWSVTDPVWYSKRNPFTEIQNPGGNFFITSTGDWVTVSSSGTLHLQVMKIPAYAQTGGNFLIHPVSGRILAVDDWGYPVDTQTEISDWLALGWNWLITGDGVLITLRKSGVAPGNGVGMLTRKIGWSFGDVARPGGTFFVRSGGGVVTISELTGYFREWDRIQSGIRLVGGTYLVDGERRLWTVDEDGVLIKTDRILPGEPVVHGKRWMIFADGAVWFIDNQGRVKGEVMLIRGSGGGPERTSFFFEKVDRSSLFKSSLKPMFQEVNHESE